MCARMLVFVRLLMHVRVCACVSLHAYLQVCLCLHVCVCVFGANVTVSKSVFGLLQICKVKYSWEVKEICIKYSISYLK